MEYPPSANTGNVHYSYDGYGRRTGMTDGTGSSSWTYDDLDNKTDASTTYTGLAAQTLSYAYYPDGTLETLSLPNSTSFTYSYDGAARLVGLVNPSGQNWSWQYLDNDWLESQADNNRITVHYTRNARGFLTDLNNSLTNGGATLSDYSVTSWDTAGNPGQVTTNLPAVSGYTGAINYTHDSQVELTQETSTRNGGYSNSFVYDAAGNPKTFRNVSQSFNADNQNTANGYDGNGNPTTYKGVGLTFDAENRMASFGSALTAGYRGDGLRGWKQTSNGTTYFFYDGEKPILEENAGGTVVATNTFSPMGLLARTSSTRTLLYTQDFQGNVSQQYDSSSGSLIASYMFDAYGARNSSSNDQAAINEPFTGFGGGAGYYTDWETGLEMLGYRYYDPGAGRFLTRDPIAWMGGVNLYEYVSNSPLGRHDSRGLEVEDPDPGLSKLISCIGALIGLTGGLQPPGSNDPPCISNAICNAVGQCLTGLGCAALGGAGFGLCGPICGCIADAFCGVLQTIVQGICGALANCGDPSGSMPNMCDALNNIAMGCLGSAVPPGPWGWGIGIFGGAISGFISGACHSKQWGGG